MTIPLNTGTGLFDIWGGLGGLLNNLNGLLGTTAPSPSSAWGSGGQSITAFGTQVDNLTGKFATAQKNLLDQLYTQRDAFRQTPASFKQYLQQTAQAVLVQMANQDTPLAALDVAHALDLLITQMTGVATVKASVVTAGTVTAVGSPHGDPAIVFSVLDANGKTCEYALPETVTVVCTQDSQQGSLAGSETLEFRGQTTTDSFGQAVGALDWDWPVGSGVTLSTTVADPTQDAQGGAGNLLTNSGFEVASTANVADNWTTVVGTAGTNMLVSSTHYSGSKSLEFLSDGTNLNDVYQEFNHAASTTVGAGGTPSALAPSTQYAYSFRVRVTATPTNGTLTVSLRDASSAAGAVTADNNSANNTANVDLTAQTTSWAIIKGTFRTPAVLPSALRLHFALTGTILDSGKGVFIDHVCFQAMQQMYNGGPSVAAASGAAILINGFFPDTWTCAVGNTWGKFQELMVRFLDITNVALPSGKPAVLPSSGSPTVSDSLVA